jgi:hypothetical protein
MRILGCTEKEYRWFVTEAQNRSQLRPGEPTCFLIIPFLIQLVIGIALSLLGNLLAPKPSNKPPPRLSTKQVDGQNLVQGNRFTAKDGFDSLQNVVQLGSTIPLIFANRIDDLDGVAYGGVRVNTNLLWSHVSAPGGSQMLRAILLLGKARIQELALQQFAIGNNLLSGYQLNPSSNESGRLSMYYRSGGGRITSADHILGIQPSSDAGNNEKQGAPDVYATRDLSGAWRGDASYAVKPSTQTTFGIYQPIGNGLQLRPNLTLRPMENVVLTSASSSSSDVRVNCVQDDQVRVLRDKQSSVFSSYAYFNGTKNSIITANVGDDITYTITTETDANYKFTAPNDAEEGCLDVATAIAGRQTEYDDAIILGELYKIGTALAICVDRTDKAFNSPANNFPVGGGNSISATFKVVEAGVYMGGNQNGDDPERPGETIFGTNRAHGFRCAVATFTIERPTDFVEIGIRSALGITFRGICDFRNTKTMDFTDDKACGYIDGKRFSSGLDIKTKNYTSGTFSGPEERYSFFRISYRVVGTSSDWIDFDVLIGARSNSGLTIYNSLSMQMPGVDLWEFQFVPVSGWEIRTGRATGNLYVMDFRENIIQFSAAPTVSIKMNGSVIQRTAQTFRLVQGVHSSGTDDIGSGQSGGVPQSVSIPPAPPPRVAGNYSNIPTTTITGSGSGMTVRFTVDVDLGIVSLLVDSGGQNYQVNDVVKVLGTAVGGRTPCDDIGMAVAFASSSTGEAAFVGLTLPLNPKPRPGNYSNIPTQTLTGNGSGLEIQLAIDADGNIAEQGSLTAIRGGYGAGYVDGNNRGSGYRNGDTVLIRGADFGGSSPCDDRVVTITSASNIKPPLSYRVIDTDGNNFIDGWGKLAEVFVFDEVGATVDRPEHEIAWINIQSKNETIPQYDNLSIIGLNIRSGTELTQFNQFSAFVRRGVESTNSFPKILEFLMLDEESGCGDIVSPELIDLQSFDECDVWAYERRYFWDGAITERQNILEFGSLMAGYFLMDFLKRGGQYVLQPMALFDKPEPVTALFTSGNIIDGTFEFSYVDPNDRTPAKVSVTWRKNRASSSVIDAGALFPTIEEVTVYETNYADPSAPLRSVDMTDFCTSEKHAIDYAKMMCRLTRLVTSRVSFKTTVSEGSLSIGKTFALGLETVAYDQPQNGVITSDGTVTAWPALADGTYQVLLWTGVGNTIEERSLTITNGKASPAGAVFCVKQSVNQLTTYKVQKLSFDEDGNIDVEGIHFPTDDQRFSLLTKDWDDANLWTIER